MTDYELQNLLDAHTNELLEVIHNSNRECNGKSGQEMMEIHRHRFAVLKLKLADQERVLDFHSGKPIAPQQLTGEAVLLPAIGLFGSQPTE